MLYITDMNHGLGAQLPVSVSVFNRAMDVPFIHIQTDGFHKLTGSKTLKGWTQF